MTTNKTIVTIFGFLVLVVSTSTAVLAQEATSSAQETPQPSASPDSMVSTDQVYTKPRQTEEILRLRELYQDQVERYTNLEREYLINKAQYEKLNTLQSLELAVKSTREVMLSRTDVLITYFELMRASLEDTEGVELVEKERNTKEMVSYINSLREHREKVLNTTTREDIKVRADEFEKLTEPFETTAYKSLALIRIGDIQTVFDKSEIIYRDVLQYHQDNETTPLRQQERIRAYREVDNAIEKTRGDLRLVRTAYAEEEKLNRSSYNSNLVKSLNTTYSGTSQILAFLEELFVELT
ncbi:MAG: hypothetical protein QG639_643 [Patescibacteria group bacterium]|nr:hypothetical protein [Patescibacteria group bacterium]